MQVITTSIDALFGIVIQISVRFVSACIDLYIPQIEDNYVHEIKEKKVEVVEEFVEMTSETATFKTIRDVMDHDVHTSPLVQKNTVMYANTPRVPVYMHPTIEFDAQIGEVPYGDMVIVLEPKGRFYHIMWRTVEGWVLRDDIADRAARVLPEFKIGEENSVDSPNTAHVRAILDDTFSLNRSEFALQAGEYALYRLWKKGITIMWPEVRPRVPGIWHKILRGVPQIHMGVIPKVGSVMEYMLNNDVGHLAFVEAVFPDETIEISEVNYPDSGIYSERKLTKEKWKMLHPVFIEIR